MTTDPIEPIDPERVEVLYQDADDGDLVAFELVERYPDTGDAGVIEAAYQTLLGPDADLAISVDDGELLVEGSTEDLPREIALAMLAQISAGLVDRAEEEISDEDENLRGFQ